MMVMMNTLKELIWKMECKGFDGSEIHFYIDIFWNLNSFFIPDPRYYVGSNYIDVFDTGYRDRLAQAHVEIDFTGYKKR